MTEMDPLPCDMVLHTTSCKFESELEKKRGGMYKAWSSVDRMGYKLWIFFCFLPPPPSNVCGASNGYNHRGEPIAIQQTPPI